MTRSFFLSIFLLACACTGNAQIITTVAGDSTFGYNGDNIPATDAELYHPAGVAFDKIGNLYITDRDNSRIRKVSATGIITTIAGIGGYGYSGDGGPATAAQLNNPYCIVLDTIGNVYFGDGGNYMIRKIDTSGIITTIAGNGTGGYNGDDIPATSAEFDGLSGLAMDKYGNMYVADATNNRVRKINAAGIITTIAGNGTCGNSGNNEPAIAAKLCSPSGVALDGNGNLYILEYTDGYVRKIDGAGIITAVAGTGVHGYNGDNIPATSAELFQPLGIAVDDNGNVYVGDSYNERIRKIDASGMITTIAGTGIGNYSGDNGPATAAELAGPTGIVIDNAGNVFFADQSLSHVRRIGWPESVQEVDRPSLKINIYPNPAITSLTITCSDKINSIVISNLIGQAVYSSIYNSEHAEINITDLPSGIYLLKINGIESRKFVKL